MKIKYLAPAVTANNATLICGWEVHIRLAACYRQRKKLPGATLEGCDDFHRHDGCWRNRHLSGRQTPSVVSLVHSAADPAVVLCSLSQDRKCVGHADSVCIH